MSRVAGITLLCPILLVLLLSCGSVQQGADQGPKVQQHRAGDIKTTGGIEMMYVPGGTFIMGSNKFFRYEFPCHEVTLVGFWMGKYEVTQAQFQEVMGRNPSYFRRNSQRPVEQVSWYDAVEFCNALSTKAGLRPAYTIDKKGKDPDNYHRYDDVRWTVREVPGSNGFRLPSEAEWEYAARAGTSTDYYWGDKLDVRYGWIWHYRATSPVGKKLPNAFGLYDMSGNVQEWCWDWYDNYYYRRNCPKVNPRGPSTGMWRVYRGGSYDAAPRYHRSFGRAANFPMCKYERIGFRVVLSDID
jgi:formylglycine-generating enzyme required for sulfatase activity